MTVPARLPVHWRSRAVWLPIRRKLAFPSLPACYCSCLPLKYLSTAQPWISGGPQGLDLEEVYSSSCGCWDVRSKYDRLTSTKSFKNFRSHASETHRTIHFLKARDPCYPPTRRDDKDKDKYTHKYTKSHKYTNTKCLEDPTCAIFLKSKGFKYIKYDIHNCKIKIQKYKVQMQQQRIRIQL